MNYSVFSSLMTVVMLAVFVGIVLWAYSGKRRAAFDAAARMPLDDDEPWRLPPSARRREGNSL